MRIIDVVYTGSSFTFATASLVLTFSQPTIDAYQSKRLFFLLYMFRVLLVLQTVTSLLADVVFFPECVRPAARAFCSIFLWIDRGIAIILAIGSAINMFWIPLRDSLWCGLMGCISILLFGIGKSAFRRGYTDVYKLLHSLWHCLPIWWLSWLSRT